MLNCIQAYELPRTVSNYPGAYIEALNEHSSDSVVSRTSVVSSKRNMREAGGHIIGDTRWARVHRGHCDRLVGEDASPCFECDPPGVDFERDGYKYIKWYVVREYRRRHGWYLQHRSCYNFVVAGADCCNFVEAGSVVQRLIPVRKM